MTIYGQSLGVFKREHDERNVKGTAQKLQWKKNCSFFNSEHMLLERFFVAYYVIMTS